jgi:hypothetical protein
MRLYRGVAYRLVDGVWIQETEKAVDDMKNEDRIEDRGVEKRWMVSKESPERLVLRG